MLSASLDPGRGHDRELVGDFVTMWTITLKDLLGQADSDDVCSSYAGLHMLVLINSVDQNCFDLDPVPSRRRSCIAPSFIR